MRFLIFNVVVAGALIYLVTGGDLSRLPSTDEAAHRVTNAAKIMVDRGHDLANKVIAQIDRTDDTTRREKNGGVATALTKPGAPAKLMPPVLGQKVAPPTTPRHDQELNNSGRTRLALVDGDSKKVVPEIDSAVPNQSQISDPEVLQRQAEVLAEGLVQNATNAPLFMSPRDRRRELHALSEEMEMLSAQSIAR